MENNKFKDSLKYPRTYTIPEIEDLETKFFNLIDEYQTNNSFEKREYLCYLTSAIYLVYRELYPRLSIFIPFRTKSDISFIKNILKEFSIYMDIENLEKNFDTMPISKDMSGIKPVLNDINYSLPTTEVFEELLKDPEVSELMTISDNNANFANEIEKYLRSPIHNGKEYHKLKRDLLKRIVEITPESFTNERKPKPSFKQLLDEAEYQYNYFLETDNFPTIISENEISELSKLSNDFRSRIYDRLHFSILEKTIPVVFDHPLVKNVLKAVWEYEKHSQKSDGFEAIDRKSVV